MFWKNTNCRVWLKGSGVANKVEKKFKDLKVKEFFLNSRLKYLVYLMETHQSFSLEYQRFS